MDVLWVSKGEVSSHGVEDLPDLLSRDGGFVWADIPACDQAAAGVLRDTFGFHDLAVRDCLRRSHVPKIYAYPDNLFLILHAPERGDSGHVHLLELDQFIGVRYLVTVHGPLGVGVELDSALEETRAVRSRMEAGRFRPESPAELSHAIVSRIARKLENYVSALATEIASLERRVVGGDPRDPEAVLEEIFRVRHELLTVRTMAAQSREAYGRMAALSRSLPSEGMPLIEDVTDQFDRLFALCDQEKEFLQGVLDYFESRTTTKINIAMERLALIAAILLPISAVAGIYGMNVIVRPHTELIHLFIVLGIMALVSLFMLRWTKRHGWW